MSFRFVNTTSDNPEPDEDARKTIRSQAMKDYRRRQRDEEAEGASSRSGSPSSGASQESPSSQQGSDSSKRAKAATASVQRGSASSTSKSTPSGEEGPRRSSVRRDRSEQSLSRRAGQGLFITFSLGAYTPTEPSLNVAGAQHGARPSSHLGRMLQICERYHTWLIPDRATATGFEALGAAKEDSTARMLLFALTLQSIGHLNAIGLSPTDDEEQRFKSQLLTLANRRLQDNTKALDDFTLGALACLTSYEICRGSHEALMHLSGISQIVKIRGGLAAIQSSSGLSTFLEILDLLHAAYFNTVPLYASTTTARGTFSEAVNQWHDFLRNAVERLREDGEDTALPTALAANIHLTSTNFGAARTMQFQAQSDELYRTMRDLEDGAWDEYPALQARILLTAIATSLSAAHKAWYHAYLSRLMYHTEAQYWDELKGLVIQFVEMQTLIRRPRSQTVRAIANGVEIVIDRALAHERALQVQGRIPSLDFEEEVEDIEIDV